MKTKARYIAGILSSIKRNAREFDSVLRSDKWSGSPIKLRIERNRAGFEVFRLHKSSSFRRAVLAVHS